MDLQQNMTNAWRLRGRRAVETLEHAQAAPALFKPEHVDELTRTVDRSLAEIARWAA